MIPAPDRREVEDSTCIPWRGVCPSKKKGTIGMTLNCICWWIGFGLVLWYVNPCRLFNAKSSLYMYIEYMICKHILLITFLKEPKFIIFLTMKWFQVLLYIINYSIKQPFVYTQLNDETVLFLIIQFIMSFVCTQFKCQTVLFDQ